MQIPQQSQYIDSSSSSSVKPESSNNEETGKSHPGVEKTLNGLFNKANLEELRTLYSLIHNENSTDERSLLTRLLNQEICKHTR